MRETEVTQENFEAALQEIQELRPQCKMMSFALELSGRRAVGEPVSKWLDDPQERYSRLAKVADNFEPVQLALCLFVAGEGESFETRTFTFFIFPHSPGGQTQVSSRLVTLDSRTISRLRGLQFDFNKWMQGVSSTRRTDEAKDKYQLDCERARIEARIQQASETNKEGGGGGDGEGEGEEEGKGSKKGGKSLNSKDKLIHDQTIAMIDEWLLAGKEEELTLPDLNSFMLRAVHDTIRVKYSKNQNVNFETRQSRTDAYRQEACVHRLGSAAMKERLLSALQQKTAAYRKRTGLRLLWNELTEWKNVPLVGYEVLPDIMALFHRCETTLPPTTEEFATEIHSLFPEICDVQHLIQHHSHFTSRLSGCPSEGLSDVFDHLAADLATPRGVMHAPRRALMAGVVAGRLFADSPGPVVLNQLLFKDSLHKLCLGVGIEIHEVCQHHMPTQLVLILRSRTTFHTAQIVTLFGQLDETFRCGVPELIDTDGPDIVIAKFFGASRPPPGFDVVKFTRAIKQQCGNGVVIEDWRPPVVDGDANDEILLGMLRATNLEADTSQKKKKKKNKKKK